ncbi:succinate dehydrogenase/fumarate reductase iron-sulfur subunit [Sulfurihydrogenibium azorense]|uniref:succinate dehydrogenase/fumarate reductase iron-sulfur subunit n=1 Tax=Sulfurihydrogenibium azorense TaxID=309806 RepID=UPI00391A33CE
MIIKILRSDRRVKTIFKYEITNIEKRITILEVLDYIKNYLDPSLSYRSNCRASICGTCGVKVNGKSVLACKTKALDLAENNTLLIEPVDNMPIIKDLIVDQDEFLEKLKKAKAWFEPRDNFEKVYPQDLALFEKETDCILCGICYSVCPAFQNDKNFGGPINFIKIFRFWKDKNDALGNVRIEIAKENNITSCIHCKYCTFSCPKEIPVESDIMQLEFFGKQKGIIQSQDNFGFGFNFGF